MNELDDLFKQLAEERAKDPKYQKAKKLEQQVKESVQEDLSSIDGLFHQLAEERNKDVKYQKVKKIEEQVKESVKTDLGMLFAELSTLKEKRSEMVKDNPQLEEPQPEEIKEAVVQPQLIDEVVLPTPIGRVPDEAQMPDIDKYLKPVIDNTEKTDPLVNEFKRLNDKIKFLERWVGQIQNAGPGGGEVNFRYLDDIDRSTIMDGNFLTYNADTKKFEFREVVGGSGGTPQVQSDWTVTDDTLKSFIKNKPALFSGDYNDLTSKPTLFSGSYTDLTNKPSIPVSINDLEDVNAPSPSNGQVLKYNATLGHWEAGADITGAGGSGIALTDLSAAVDDTPSGSGNLTYNSASGKFTYTPPVLFSGSYTDLTNKPTLFSGSYTDLTNKPVLFSGAYADLTGKPTLFSGSYTDLTNKPTIPAAQIQSDWNQSNTSSLDYIKNKPSIPSLTGYATESYVTTAITNLIGAAPSALDTLKEIADQLAADESVVSSLTTSVAGKVSLTGSYANPSWITSLAGSKVTNAVLTTDTGTVTNAMLAGSIANAKLANSSININGTNISLGGSANVPAAASTLTGNTLNSTVVSSSLTSVGALDGLTVNHSTSGYALSISGTAAPAFGTQTWKFWTNGSVGGQGSRIEFPDGTYQYTAYTGNAVTVTNGIYLTDVGSVTNTMLEHSSITVNGTSISLGASATVTAAADTLTGTSLPDAVISSKLTSVGTLAQAKVNYVPGTTTGAAIELTAKNSQGGTGFADFFKLTNIATGASNATKWLRLNLTGTLEVLNNAYSSVLMSLSDSGDLNVKNSISINGKIAVNGPAFSVYQNTPQSVPTDVQTKLNWNVEEYDTNGNFASNRFTPTVEGYYALTAAVRFDSGIGTGERMIVIYKNGSEYKRAYNTRGTAAVGDSWMQMEINCQVYANGTSDYFEVYAMHGAGANRNTTGGAPFTYFQGCMIRGA